MGKKYLDIKENSLESSVYNVLHGIQEKKLDPVGKEDGDIDNDGDKDASDKYLAKRRKTVAKAIKKDKKEGNAFGMALKSAKDNGEKTFVVSGKTYNVEGLEDSPNTANSQHLCAKNVVHENWGNGIPISGQHAEPDTAGDIAWYDVMFEHGIERGVSINELKVTKAESHHHSEKKKKKMDEAAGTFTIVANGISDLKKADEKYLEDTEYSIAAGLAEDGVELDEEGVSYKGNSIMIPSDNEDMRMVQSWARNQTKLAADTVKMIKPNMDYNDLYEERADHLYVAALLTNTAKPNKAPKYTVKFMKEEVDLDEGTYRIGNMKMSGNFKAKNAEDAIKQAMKKGMKVDREFTVFDRDKREFIYKNDKPAMATKGTYKEEVDLEEASGAEIAKKMKKAGKIFGPKAISQVAKMKKVSRDDLEKMIPDYVSGAEITKLFEEEVDLEEGKMNQMHQMMKDKKSAEQIAKAMKLDLKTVKALMDGYNKMVPESFEIGTEKYLKHTVSSTPGQKAWNETVSKKAASMRETLAKIWEADVGKSPFQKNAKEDLTKGVKGGKTMTGKKVAAVDTSPIIKEKKK